MIPGNPKTLCVTLGLSEIERIYLEAWWGRQHAPRWWRLLTTPLWWLFEAGVRWEMRRERRMREQ